MDVLNKCELNCWQMCSSSSSAVVVSSMTTKKWTWAGSSWCCWKLNSWNCWQWDWPKHFHPTCWNADVLHKGLKIVVPELQSVESLSPFPPSQLYWWHFKGFAKLGIIWHHAGIMILWWRWPKSPVYGQQATMAFVINFGRFMRL